MKFLDYIETKNPHAIETIVCQEILLIPHVKMDEETRMLMALLLSEKNSINIPEKEKPFLYAVIEKRVTHCFTIQITDSRLLLFLAFIAKSPGVAILYLWYLQYWCFNSNIRKLDLETFCEIFPMGFPTDLELRRIWNSQKVDREAGSDNLVDYSSAGMSIQFVSEKK